MEKSVRAYWDSIQNAIMMERIVRPLSERKPRPKFQFINLKKITRKERKEKETTRKARKDKRRRGSKERKREE